MNFKDKELLFKDICPRLPAGVKVQTPEGDFEVTGIYKYYYKGELCIRIITESDEENKHNDYPIESVKLYLIPFSETIHSEEEPINFINGQHVDYNNLIEKGFAVKATKGIYKNFI